MLGLFEVICGRWLGRSLGLDGKENIVRLYGGREILTGIAILVPLAASKRQSLSLPRGSNLALVAGIGLIDTGAFVASALGFATGNVAIVSVLASLYSAVAVLLAAIFLRERLRVIQWTGIGILLVGVVLTHL